MRRIYIHSDMPKWSSLFWVICYSFQLLLQDWHLYFISLIFVSESLVLKREAILCFLFLHIYNGWLLLLYAQLRFLILWRLSCCSELDPFWHQLLFDVAFMQLTNDWTPFLLSSGVSLQHCEVCLIWSAVWRKTFFSPLKNRNRVREPFCCVFQLYCTLLCSAVYCNGRQKEVSLNFFV